LAASSSLRFSCGDDEWAEIERAEILRLKQDFSAGEFCAAFFLQGRH
jgi:hypothetical protein